MAERGSASEAAAVVVAAVALIALALTALRAIDTEHLARQGLAATIEIVLDAPPTQEVTINGYHAVVKYQDSEGYHLVFVVPSNRTYVLHPSCCSRLRYLTPGKRYYAYWLGGCVAVRTDR